jgi:hypothetical protein
MFRTTRAVGGSFESSMRSALESGATSGAGAPPPEGVGVGAGAGFGVKMALGAGG